MKKHWQFTEHFAQRFLDRIGNNKPLLSKIRKYFDNNVLQCVFHCELMGYKQRVKIEDVVVCYKFDPDAKKLLVTTVYKG